MSMRALALAAGLALIAPEGRAAGALDEVFPDGLPVPFAAVIDRLRAFAGPQNVATALIPLGRSLQRYGADPDYFGSPRILVAVTGDRAGPGSPRLADRVFLAYQPAAEIIEAMSYDEASGRFAFAEVVRYPERTEPEPAEQRVCVTCHQGAGPIFARPLWAETNANPAVAVRLAGLGPEFHGAPVLQTIDGLEAFDAATDRAARIEAANRLWSEGCADAGCRAALLAAALRAALGVAAPQAAPAAFVAGARWPDGLSVVSPDLPNRDPLPAGSDLETSGRMNPETPRDPLVIWRPEDGFAGAAREIAAGFGPGDIAWIDALLRSRGAPAETLALACVTTVAGAERRFDCGDGAARMRGFRDARGGWRIDAPFVGSDGGRSPRLPDGRRVADLSVDASGIRLRLVDDLAPLEAALAARAAQAPALGPGPFRRQAVLALIADTEAADG
jgi:hypothetical protein